MRSERRKFLRIETELESEFWAKGPTMTAGKATIRDFSREGLKVQFPSAVYRGEHVDLTMKVPGDNLPIFATAEVAWAQNNPGSVGVGAGLKFLSIKPLDLARLLDFVYSRWLGSLRSSA